MKAHHQTDDPGPWISQGAWRALYAGTWEGCPSHELHAITARTASGWPVRKVSRRQGQQRVNPAQPVCRSGEIRVDASRSDLPLALASALRVKASLEQDRRTDVQERGAQESTN